LPDGESGIFFARGLDRPNQLDAAREFSFEAQRLRGPQYHASERPEAGIDPPSDNLRLTYIVQITELGDDDFELHDKRAELFARGEFVRAVLR
jgi:hypothetical protein